MENKKINIIFDNFSVEGILFQSKTAEKLTGILPVEENANLWGDEIYFTIDVNESLDDSARELVEKGDIGFWPQGPALCFFFGPTPISSGKEIKPASAVNIIGKIERNLSKLKTVKSGERVKIEIA